MEKERTVFGTISEVIRLANPIFVVAAVCVPIGALIYANYFGTITILNYVHVLTGGLWTGIDLFMGLILGPILGGLDPKTRSNVFMRLVPKMTFFMPVIAAVTVTSGFQMIDLMGFMEWTDTWVVAALVITGILAIQGFGFILPNEIRIFRQLLSGAPDLDKISRLGLRTARISGLQGIFQLAIIFVMSNLRY